MSAPRERSAIRSCMISPTPRDASGASDPQVVVAKLWRIGGMCRLRTIPVRVTARVQLSDRHSRFASVVDVWGSLSSQQAHRQLRAHLCRLCAWRLPCGCSRSGMRLPTARMAQPVPAGPPAPQETMVCWRMQHGD